MAKVLLDYEEATGQVKLPDGTLIGTYYNLKTHEEKDADVVELVRLGLTADELVKLKNNGLI